MKRQKLITVLMAAVLTVSLCGCGKAGEANVPANTQISEETPAEDVASDRADIENIEAEEVEDIEETADEEENIAESNSTDEAFDTTAVMEETILVDENDVKITATGLNFTDYNVELELLIENNSTEDLSFISGSLGYSCNAVNGYMVDSGYLNTEVGAGKKSNETIDFSREELLLTGIMEIADIQVGFEISDSDYNSTYTGVKQIKTTLADSYDYEADSYQKSINNGILSRMYGFEVDYFATEELYQQSGVKMVSEAVVTNRKGNKLVLLEVENTSNESVYSVTTDVAVNGVVFSRTRWSVDSINPGARRIIGIDFSTLVDNHYQEALGITDIGTFSCSFKVEDSEHDEKAPSQEISISVPGKENSFDAVGTELYNEKGIRIISKGLYQDDADYSDDIHLVLLVENASDFAVYMGAKYDSLSVNGFMTDYMSYSGIVSVGKWAVLDVELQASSLEKNKIMGIDDITELELTIEMKDEKYRDIAEPKVKITY